MKNVVLFDVNILVYAHREDTSNHTLCFDLVNRVVNGAYPFGFSDFIASGFLRIITHPQIFNPPTPIRNALSFVSEIRNSPNAVHIQPKKSHWDIFVMLCKETEVKGNLIPDAYLAALAIESGCLFITTDRDYSRFSDLDWKHPKDV
jgi:toxin-antitoxin system PIN domain toxin